MPPQGRGGGRWGTLGTDHFHICFHKPGLIVYTEELSYNVKRLKQRKKEFEQNMSVFFAVDLRKPTTTKM